MLFCRILMITCTQYRLTQELSTDRDHLSVLSSRMVSDKGNITSCFLIYCNYKLWYIPAVNTPLPPAHIVHKCNILPHRMPCISSSFTCHKSIFLSAPLDHCADTASGSISICCRQYFLTGLLVNNLLLCCSQWMPLTRKPSFVAFPNRLP